MRNSTGDSTPFSRLAADKGDGAALLHAIFQLAEVLLVLADEAGRVLQANEYAKRLLGEGCGTGDWFADADSRRKFEEVCAGGEIVEGVELALRGKGGERLAVRCQVAPVGDGKRLWMGRDTMCPEILRQRIAESEAWFLELGRARNVGFWHHKIHDEWIYLDPFLQGLVGEEWLVDGRLPREGWRRLVPENEYEPIRAYLAEQFRTGASQFEFRCRFRAQPHGSLWGVVRGTIFRDAAGRVLRVAGLVEDTTELEREHVALQQAERKFQLLAGSVRDLFYIASPDGSMEFVSPAFEKIWGMSPEQLQQAPLSWLDQVYGEDRAAVVALHRGCEGPREAEFRVLSATGMRWVTARVTPILDEAGSIAGYAGLVVDVTEERKNTWRLNHLLREKELMLAELHHRVKNNLQIISSIVGLQGARMGNSPAAQELQAVQSRIRAIAVIHEMMYGSECYSRVDFGSCARVIAERLFEAFDAGRRGIELHLDLAPVILSVEYAVTCGLLLNELVSNSLKHAFPGRRSGTVGVRLRNISGTETLLEVFDNGIGLREFLPEAKPATLGLSMIAALVRQIKATFSQANENGVKFSITFENPWIPTSSFVEVEPPKGAK